MSRKLSDQERLLEFALRATPEQLDTAIDTLRAVRRASSPQPEKKKKAAKKPVARKAAGGPTNTTNTSSSTEQTSNGFDN